MKYSTSTNVPTSSGMNKSPQTSFGTKSTIDMLQKSTMGDERGVSTSDKLLNYEE